MLIRIHSDTFYKTSRYFSEYIQIILRTHSDVSQNTFRYFSEYIQILPRIHSNTSQNTFKYSPEYIQMHLRIQNTSQFISQWNDTEITENNLKNWVKGVINKMYQSKREMHSEPKEAEMGNEREKLKGYLSLIACIRGLFFSLSLAAGYSKINIKNGKWIEGD